MFRPGWAAARLNMFGRKPEEEDQTKSHNHSKKNNRKQFFFVNDIKANLESHKQPRRENVENYCYYICWRSCYMFAVCCCVFYFFYFSLRQKNSNKKTIINHFIYFATYAHEKSVRHSRSCNRRLLIPFITFLMALFLRALAKRFMVICSIGF